MNGLYHIAVWVHILSAMLWIGGSGFLVLVVVPVLRKPEFKALSASLMRYTGLRFRIVGWICLLLLVISGIFILGFRGYGWQDLFSGRIFMGTFGNILAIKLSLVGMILAISAMHDFYLGPRAMRLILENPDSPQTAGKRKIASWLARITLLLGLGTVLAAISLLRGWPW